MRVNLEWAIGDAALAAGRLVEATDAWHRAGALGPGVRHFTALLSARAALWAADAPTAAADLAVIEVSGVHGPVVEASRGTIRAGIAALDGHAADALFPYRDALRAWRDLGLAWDEALTGIDMATLLDPANPDVRAAGDRAREILATLGAKPFLERLDAAMVHGRLARVAAQD